MNEHRHTRIVSFRTVRVVGAVLLLGAAALVVERPLHDFAVQLKIVPIPAHYTELYFVDPPHVSAATGSRPHELTYSFAVHAVHTRGEYSVRARLIQDGVATEIDRTALTLESGELRHITRTIPEKGVPLTGTLLIDLVDTGQTLHYQLSAY